MLKSKKERERAGYEKMFKMCIGIRNLLKHMDTQPFFINYLFLNKDKMKKPQKEAWVSMHKDSMGSIGTYIV
jgi:hypothetical protein